MKNPITIAEDVDLSRFMGKWYVVGNIPTYIERDAYNATETYTLDEIQRVRTTFQFHKGGFDGPQKTYRPTGFVSDESNAIWGMRFIWPLKSDYRIVYIADDYSQTIIGRNKRDYVWIMTRSPQISEADFERLSGLIRDEGYDIQKLRKVPQRW